MASDERQCQRACSLLVRGAVRSAGTGRIRRYFESESEWEAPMRTRFVEVQRSLSKQTDDARTQAVELFTNLNAKYRTRFDRAYHKKACELVLEHVPQDAERRDLLRDSEDVVNSVSEIVPQVLRKIRGLGVRRPYSLTTKFLHFLFPDLFVIYDSQAADSIRMWSLFAIEDDEPGRKQSNYGRLSDEDGTGYREMLDAYRTLWWSCTDKERICAHQAADALGTLLRRRQGNELARVTVLDLIDKHLWTARGNPIWLGLASPP